MFKWHILLHDCVVIPNTLFLPLNISMVVIANAISDIIFHDYNNTNVVMEDICILTTWMFTRYGRPILEIF
jgi:hypothetical protein